MHKTKLAICLFVGCSLSVAASAQIRQNWRLFPGESESETVRKDSLSTPRDTAGSVEVKMAPGIEDLEDKFVRHNKKNELMAGYRLEIFSASGSNSRNKAQAYKRDFTLSYDSIPAYVVWENPNYEVRIGDCRTKLEAEALRQFIKEDYPRAFIKQDEIRLPELEK